MYEETTVYRFLHTVPISLKTPDFEIDQGIITIEAPHPVHGEGSVCFATHFSTCEPTLGTKLPYSKF